MCDNNNVDTLTSILTTAVQEGHPVDDRVIALLERLVAIEEQRLEDEQEERWRRELEDMSRNI